LAIVGRRRRQRGRGLAEIALCDEGDGRLRRIARGEIDIGLVQHEADGRDHEQAAHGGDDRRAAAGCRA
jgi:hypothetical protein